MNPGPITEAELQAWADGRLPAERQAAVDVYLAQQPEEAARLQAYRRQTRQLRELFEPTLRETVPDTLTRAVPHRAPPPAPGRALFPGPTLGRLAAGILLALSGAAGGWLARDRMPAAPSMAALPHQAAVAHVVYSPEVRRPVEVGADQEGQLVAWLSKRLGTPVQAPRLGSLGYELIGGRLLPGNSGPVAQFMYHDGGGQRLTLYISTEVPGQRDTAFRFAQEGPVNVFYWVDGRFGYALSGGIDKAELSRVATLVYGQLDHQ
ncbi:MAG TPA: anti-sigma factor [Azospira sp.]|nr:anti-sigma factor [Azospira sp.]